MFLPGRIRQGLSDEAYLTLMDPAARATAAARKVRCELCQVELATSSLASHLESQHDVRHCYLGETVCPVAHASYEALFMPETGKWLCPVPDCLQGWEGRGCSNEANLWSYFAHRHPHGTVSKYHKISKEKMESTPYRPISSQKITQLYHLLDKTPPSKDSDVLESVPTQDSEYQTNLNCKFCCCWTSISL